MWQIYVNSFGIWYQCMREQITLPADCEQISGTTSWKIKILKVTKSGGDERRGDPFTQVKVKSRKNYQ